MSEKYETTFTAVVRDTDRRLVKDGTLTLYDVYTDDGTRWSTFKSDVWNQARALTGQLADWRGTIEQKENFTNHTLMAIRAHQDGFQGSRTQPPPPQQQPQPQQAETLDYTQFKASQAEQELRKQESIHRQTAGKVAAVISETAEEFWANIQDVKVYFDSGVVPFAYRRESSMRSHPGDESGSWGADPGPEQRPEPTYYSGQDDPDRDIPFLPTIDGFQ